MKKRFNYKKIHFIGVGGISMSALALLMLHNGILVSGSDLMKNDETVKFEGAGGKFFLGHKSDNISSELDLVVFTGAVKSDNIELITAKKLKIKCLERSEFLGEICSNYKHVIAVSGTHGKTTTTAILGHIFHVAGLNPTVHVGGESLNYGNLLMGGNDYFITEACEYRNSFKYIKSDVAIITNIDAEHLDYYENVQNENKAFENFARNTKLLITNEKVAIEHKFECLICDKFKNKNYWVKEIVKNKISTRFTIMFGDSEIGRFTINLIGEHNIKNTLFAVAVALNYGIDLEIIKVALASFKGVKRRYELIGELFNKPVICDYAHHPNEIRNSIKGLIYKYKKILVVFQPHTYSRTEKLLLDFKDAFINSQKVIIYKTYPAREIYNPNGDEEVLYHFISNETKALALNESELISRIKENLRGWDLILVLGAGDIYQIFKDITKKYGKLY